MGQQSSKAQKNPPATKSISSLKRVSRLFQPGLKDQRGASGSSTSSPQPSRGEDSAVNRPAQDEPEAGGRPAETADNQVTCPECPRSPCPLLLNLQSNRTTGRRHEHHATLTDCPLPGTQPPLRLS